MPGNKISDDNSESEREEDHAEGGCPLPSPPRYTRYVEREQGYVDLRCGHGVPADGQPNVLDMNANEMFRPECIFCDSERQVPRDIKECDRRMGELESAISCGRSIVDSMVAEYDAQAAFKRQREEYGQGLESECTRVLKARLAAHLAYKKAQSKLPESQRDEPQRNLLKEALMDRRANENAQCVPTGTSDAGVTDIVAPARLERLPGEDDCEYVLRKREAEGSEFNQRAERLAVAALTAGSSVAAWQTPANPAPSRGGFTEGRGRGRGQNHNSQRDLSFAPP
ncbi:hypothetical protein LTR97_005375 [Elasticomyces elasticus]|uniref:Uncharacterized protein n=1 Tax=Elasticomyces elasticus TaxID=574655 RepID=A0AAN7WKR8_9PEZI|nr:hypothetical protein LTR97_005375 [Elasticomyces elasticus]